MHTLVAVIALVGVEYILFGMTRMSAQEVAVWGGFFFLLSFLALFNVISYGTDIRNRDGHVIEYVLRAHQAYVNVFLLVLLLAIVAVEIAIQKHGGLWGEVWLRYTHFGLVGLSVVAFLSARFWVTGLRSPLWHRRSVYSFTTFFTGAGITGSTLLLTEFPLW